MSEGLPTLVAAHNPAKSTIKPGLPVLVGGENPVKSGTPEQQAAAVKAAATLPAQTVVAAALPVQPSAPPVKKDVSDLVTAVAPELAVRVPRVVPAYEHDKGGNIFRNLPSRRLLAVINHDCTKAELERMVAALNTYATEAK